MKIIIGDSWACGEWSVTASATAGVTHGGIAAMLYHQGHDVINLGIPGNNNRDVVRYLRWFLQNNTNFAVEQAIIFKSDIARNINPPDITRGYIEFRNATNYGFYYQLSEVACKYQIPCLVIGGSSDTLPKSIEQVDRCQGITIAIESFTDFLLTGDPTSTTSVYSLWQEHDSTDKLEQIKKYSTDMDVKELLKDLELADRRLSQCVRNPDLFPDGGHPGAKAHQMLLDFLTSENLIK